MERLLISVEAVKYGDLILEAKADDTHHVYVDVVNSTYEDDGHQIVITNNGYGRYAHGQIVTVLRGVKL
jgi:hypothetical protein